MHNADLEWDDEGIPRSSRFGDIYFSRAGGLAESEYVFLRHNRLAERFSALQGDAPRFTIAETGFGTGLNFILAWRCFLAHAPSDARLHYLSAEAFPLSLNDVNRALAAWPELAEFSLELRQAYPESVPGFHRLVLAGGRVHLTLMFGDAATVYQQNYAWKNGVVDAWFLDGFAPGKNPDMWTPSLFRAMARLSKSGASFATFTAAGFVRRELQAAGFETEKVRGFGQKREMLTGRYSQPATVEKSAPWFTLPQPASERRAAVIGAGIAGTATALALAERGWQVTLLDRHPEPGAEASGNRAGALYPHLHRRYTPATRLFLSSYLYALRHLQRLQAIGHEIPGGKTGVALLAYDEERREQLRAILQGLELPSSVLADLRDQPLSLAGISDGLWFPDGCWLNPPALCRAQSRHPNIHLCLGVGDLEFQRDDAGWMIRDANRSVLAKIPVLILATGSATRHFDFSRELPLGVVRGQVSHVRATALSSQLQEVLCYEGYLTPAFAGWHCLGASFERGLSDYEPSAREHEENREKLRRVRPELADALGVIEDGRVGYRLSCRDHLPIVGPVPDFDGFREDYRELPRGFAWERYPKARYLDGLYLNIAHGSRGLTTAPLMAELLAAQLNGEALPVEAALWEAVSPARFLIRELQKPA